jgi:acyl-CoA hydrolase
MAPPAGDPVSEQSTKVSEQSEPSTAQAARAVRVSELISPTHCDVHGLLLPECLLKWMDATACLAAEQHCRKNAVTISLDDLHLEANVPAGSVLVLVCLGKELAHG